ncbi:hypothetical protein [Longispora urticae]
MGTVVVEGAARFGGRIATVVSGDGAAGYLLVHVEVLPWSDGTTTTGVDLLLMLDDGNGNWSFSDRADPDDTDALEELNTGTVDWYGRTLTVTRWLEGSEADEIRRTRFADIDR